MNTGGIATLLIILIGTITIFFGYWWNFERGSGKSSNRIKKDTAKVPNKNSLRLYQRGKENGR